MQVAKPERKDAAPKYLQTIDDPYFDEDGALPPEVYVGSRKASRVVSPTSPPANPAATSAKGLVVARTREVQYAMRARQRRLNLFIGVVVFGVTVSVLLFLGVAVFSRPHRDAVTATASHVGDADVNGTQNYVEVEHERRLRIQPETTPVEEQRDHYEVTATVAVGRKRNVKTNSHLRSPRKPALLMPRPIAVDNGTLGARVGKMIEKSPGNATPQNLRKSSSYTGWEKKRIGLEKLMRDSGSPLSVGNCSVSCKVQVAFFPDELDLDYNPCESLYDHVCSNWQTKYAKLAGKRGSYSVDDSILVKFQAQLAHHILTVDEAAFRQSRQLFRDCVNGTLVTKEDFQYLLEHFKIGHTSSSVEALAEVIVRMSRLGVSPFFDVKVNKKGNDISVTLLPPTFSTEEDQDADVFNRRHAGQNGQAGGEVAVTATKALIQAIERHLCSAVIGESNSGANCFVTPDSVTTPPWNYEWYKSTGLKHLAFHAASIFWPLFLAPETSYSSFGPNLETSDYSVHVEACLRFVERYDPYLLVHSALSIAGTPFEQRGTMVMDSLRRILEQRIFDAPRISIKFGVPASGSLLRNISNSPGNDHVSFNGSRLKQYLIASTWKRWTQGIGGYHVLSTTPTFLKDTLHVPLSVFDLTSAVQDTWFWYLSVFARVGPRFLKPILMSIPAEVLNETKLIRCLRNTSTVSDGARPKTNFASLDVVQIASFAYSLEAFHSHLARNAVVPERNVSTHALFLYHYVFNKCTAVPSGRQEESNLMARLSRFEVDSVSNALGASLLHECATHPGVHDCWIGSK